MDDRGFVYFVVPIPLVVCCVDGWIGFRDGGSMFLVVFLSFLLKSDNELQYQ